MPIRYKKPLNPFPTSGYYGPSYFCDREAETKQITQLLQNGQSCLLIGKRRLGKTALIHHIRHFLPKTWGFVYLDILATENEQQLLNALGTALLQQFPEKDPLGKRIWDFVKTLRPIISFDQLNGIPQVSFQISQAQRPVVDILDFLSKQENPVVIAIDEFQQIHSYPEKNTDAWLRSAIQQLQNVFFLFSGSQQTLLNQLFSDPTRPFYRSANPFVLKTIDPLVYRKYILSQFKAHGKSLSPEIAEQILDWTKGHTYYVQALCNRVFQLDKAAYEEEDWKSCAQKILDEGETFFLYYRTLLSPQQWKLAVAISKAGRVFSPTSKNFIQDHQLGSGATVLKSLQALIDKEIVSQDSDPEGKSYYEVNDVFFERWVQATYGKA
ncbi:AAA family ATPase [Algoriphagus taiwanensis]|uniref:ATP-binding protein n=1 Tax=Algoriphagus taiwanensis TaxID=1445656 RepID=A0ABQ6PW14_9BACT|nr:ATP-binding protein [Algoriphagus taiwanensis]